MASYFNRIIGFSLVLGLGGVAITKWIDRTHANAPAERVIATRADDGAATRRNTLQAPAPVAMTRTVQPPKPTPSTFGVVTIEAGSGGHFFAEFEIRGRRIPMMIDTGASIIALTDDDARAAGFYPQPSDYVAQISTANGTIKAAPVTIGEVRLQGLSVRDVRAVIMPRGAMSQSLLGMSFLGKLRGYEVAAGRLVLRQ